MIKHILTTFAVLLLAAVGLAQDQIPEKLLLATGNYNGPSARALGLGGTYTGIADDYSSIWWNPAGLAQVKRIEMQGSISRTGFSNDADYFGTARDGKTNATRLNNIGMVLPVPVYQGALSFAFGYNQIVGYESRVRTPQLLDTDLVEFAYDRLESGRLGFWSFASAVDVSRNLSLGAGVNYWTGTNEYTYTEYEPNIGDAIKYEESYETKLRGWNFSFGGLFRAGRFARIGAAVQTAVPMNLREDYVQNNTSGYWDYRMTYPAVFRFGGSIAPGRWLVAADIEYRDWQSLRFRSDPPFDNITKSVANQAITDTYKSTTRISFGGEYLFPAYGVRARAGYSFEPTNFVRLGSEADKSVISFGAGVLIDRSVMLDMTYRTSSYEETFRPNLTENIRSSAAVMTISYRM